MMGKRTGMFKKCVKYAIIGLVLIFMYVPILILAAVSYTHLTLPTKLEV